MSRSWSQDTTIPCDTAPMPVDSDTHAPTAFETCACICQTDYRICLHLQAAEQLNQNPTFEPCKAPHVCKYIQRCLRRDLPCLWKGAVLYSGRGSLQMTQCNTVGALEVEAMSGSPRRLLRGNDNSDDDQRSGSACTWLGGICHKNRYCWTLIEFLINWINPEWVKVGQGLNLIFRNLVMSRLVQGPITGEMRLGFLIQDICTFAFGTSWLSPTRRAWWFTATLSVHCLEEILHSGWRFLSANGHWTNRVLPSFFIFVLFLFLSCQILSQIHFLRGKSVARAGHPRILPWQRREEAAWSDYPQHALKR